MTIQKYSSRLVSNLRACKSIACTQGKWISHFTFRGWRWLCVSSYKERFDFGLGISMYFGFLNWPVSRGEFCQSVLGSSPCGSCILSKIGYFYSVSCILKILWVVMSWLSLALFHLGFQLGCWNTGVVYNFSLFLLGRSQMFWILGPFWIFGKMGIRGTFVIREETGKCFQKDITWV